MIFNIFSKRQIQLDELGWKWNFSYLQENPPVQLFAKKLSVATKESIFIVPNNAVNLGWDLSLHIDCKIKHEYQDNLDVFLIILMRCFISYICRWSKPKYLFVPNKSQSHSALAEGRKMVELSLSKEKKMLPALWFMITHMAPVLQLDSEGCETPSAWIQLLCWGHIMNMAQSVRFFAF